MFLQHVLTCKHRRTVLLSALSRAPHSANLLLETCSDRWKCIYTRDEWKRRRVSRKLIVGSCNQRINPLAALGDFWLLSPTVSLNKTECLW